ncbi:unnamed protein product [Ixodes pacificus]
MGMALQAVGATLCRRPPNYLLGQSFPLQVLFDVLVVSYFTIVFMPASFQRFLVCILVYHCVTFSFTAPKICWTRMLRRSLLNLKSPSEPCYFQLVSFAFFSS